MSQRYGKQLGYIRFLHFFVCMQISERKPFYRLKVYPFRYKTDLKSIPVGDILSEKTVLPGQHCKIRIVFVTAFRDF